MADFVNVMQNYNRMCHSFNVCRDGCPLMEHNAEESYDDCLQFAFKCPEAVQDAVEKWVEQNPEPKFPTIKKYLWEMFEQYGIAQLTDEGFDLWMRYTEIPADIADKLGIKPLED